MARMTDKTNVRTPFHGRDSIPVWNVITNSQQGSFDVAQGWQRMNTFQSADNPEWVALQRGEITNPKLRKILRGLDLGNGMFFKEDVSLSALSHYNHYVPPLGGSNGTTYHGPILPTTSQVMRAFVLEQVPWPTKEETTQALFGAGATAISRTLPTRSHMSLGVTLGELRKDGLPKLISMQSLKDFSNSPVKTGADAYLNANFAWAPLIRDVESLLRLVSQSTKILRDYERGSKVHTRRGYQFDDVVQGINARRATTVAAYPNSSNLYSNSGAGKLVVSGSYTMSTWFRGAYEYTLPGGNTFWSNVARWESEANRLLGLRITPELLWNVISWTWLLDWFVNVGDVITNISYLGRDGLVLRYGYIMRSIRVEADAWLDGARPRSESGIQLPITCRISMQQKTRVKATPYGFGLNPSSFSAKQWSILGALGATRAPGKL